MIKYRINKLPKVNTNGLRGMVDYLIQMFSDVYVLSAFVSAFAASLCWMLALQKLELSKAYPAMSLAPALVFFLSIWLFGESYTHGKLLGLFLIGLGVFITFKF
ncbi:EamA family transporter [Roseivirga sp.]|uniref:EamA family transporter n=1 Tax=Roseivirga sp. TaxID=1964215 RepID=UPI003B8E66BC